MLVLSFTASCAQMDLPVGGPCDGCDEMFIDMPASISWSSMITTPGEPGEPLIITGTVYKSDGTTPAPNILLYVYHTDNEGLYSKGPSQNATLRHGHLRGWIKTDATGKYQFTTIRPAPYPNRKDPAHIHPIIKEPGLSRYWIDEYLFNDDPLVTKKIRTDAENRGGSGIITITKNQAGIWMGRRDIILGMNVSGYPPK